MNVEEFINRFFDIVYREGLGRCFRCKICYNRFGKEFIVVGVADARRHIEAHNDGLVFYDDAPKRVHVEKRVSLKRWA